MKSHDKNKLIITTSIFLILLILILLGLKIRTDLIVTHFTHIDDIGVAHTILEKKKYLLKFDYKYDLFLKKLSTQEPNLFNKIFFYLNKNDFLKPLIYAIFWIKNYLFAVPLAWTYSPGQFIFTSFLLDIDQSYENKKLMGRLPSFLFNFFTIILIILLCFKLYTKNNRYLSSIIGITLFSFSWQNIIYSSHMSNYGLTSFGVLLMNLFLIKLITTKNLSNSNSFKMGLFFGILNLFHYQFLIFILPFIFTIFYYYFFKKKYPLKKILVLFLFGSIGFLIIFLTLIFPFLKSSLGNSISWNAGVNNEYLLNINTNKNIIFLIIEYLTFFILNVPEVIISNLSNTSNESNWLNFTGMLLTVMFIFGFIRSFYCENEIRKTIFIFLYSLFIVYFLLINLKLMTLSPTRHSMILTLPIIIFVLEGFIYVDKHLLITIFKKFYNFLILPSIFLILWVFIFYNSKDNIIKKRTDLYSESKIFSKIKKDNIDVIINFDLSKQLNLMPSINTVYPILFFNIVDNKFIKEGANDKNLFKRSKYNILFQSNHNCINMKLNNIIITNFLKEYNKNSHYNAKIIKNECKILETEIDWSNKTRNGSNGYSYTIYKVTKN